MSDILIKVRGLRKEFDLGKIKVQALKHIDLDIYRGEYLSVMGPSGSGKSTLFNMIGALDSPSAGEVQVAGVELSKLDSRKLAHFRGNYIGYVFQAYNLLPVLTALENAEFPLLLQGVGEEERRRRVSELFQRTGLEGLADRKPGRLSGGQQQRVAVVRAVVSKPALVLADEPTANLDSTTSENLLDMMWELNQELGTTFVFATHDARVMDRSRRLVRLVDGAIASDERRNS